MKKFNWILLLITLLTIPVFLLGTTCNPDDDDDTGDDDDDTGDDDDDDDSGTVNLTGAVEKGPFILGSTIVIAAVDADGDPTGQTFNTQTIDDLGGFKTEFAYHGLASIEANGYFFNEVTDDLSGSQLTLRAYAQLSHQGQQTVYVNLITHLSYNRIAALLDQSVAFTEAVEQAEDELRAAIAVGLPGFDPGVNGVEMNILGGNSLPNAYLFAVSAAVTQAALFRSESTKSIDAELQQLLNTMANDLADDGEIAASLTEELGVAQKLLDADMIMNHMAEYLDGIGFAGDLPNLHLVLDQDFDGYTNADDNCRYTYNPGQEDEDEDGKGDICDATERFCSPDGWCWSHPLWPPRRMFGVWAFSDSHVVVVGESVWFFDGTTWNPTGFGDDVYFTDIWGLADESAFAVGLDTAEPCVARYIDNAWTFLEVDIDESDYHTSIWASSDSDVFVTGVVFDSHGWYWIKSNIHHFDGMNWEVMTIPASEEIGLVGMWGTSSSNVYAVGNGLDEERAVVLHYNGTNWQEISTGLDLTLFFRIWGTGEDDVYVTGDRRNGEIFDPAVAHWDGVEWSVIEFTLDWTICDLWRTSSSQIWGFGSNGIASFNGVDWTLAFDAGGGSQSRIHGSSETNIFAVSSKEMFRYDGYSWTDMSNRVTNSGLLHIWGTSEANIIAVGDDGAIIRWNGSTWNLEESNTDFTLYRIWGSGPNDIYAVGPGPFYFMDSGHIVHYNGSTWQPEDVGTIPGLYGVWGAGPNDVYACGWEPISEIPYFEDVFLYYDGASWSEIDLPGMFFGCQGIAGRSAADVYLIGNEGTILRYGGVDFEDITPEGDYDLVDIAAGSDGAIYAFGDALLRFDGNEWEGSLLMTGDEPFAIQRIWFAEDGTIFGSNATQIFHFNGYWWSEMDPGLDGSSWARIAGIWGSSAVNVYAAGYGTRTMSLDDGFVLHYTPPE